MAMPTIKDDLNNALNHHLELKEKARKVYEKQQDEYYKRLKSLNIEISKITKDLDRTEGNNYPTDGLFYPKQN